MNDVIADLTNLDWLHAEHVADMVRAFLLFVVGALIARFAGRAAARVAGAKFSPQEAMLIRRAVHYGLLTLVFAAGLQQLGFKLSVLVGAAGVLTVAVGFASQTAASNLISGMFLVAERPFQVGDVIRVDDVQGEVLSIDLLSIKLRSFDNLFVRIPNEQIIKSRVTTTTRFPIRRYDLLLGVSYDADLESVRNLVEEVAHRNPMCLEEPPPVWIFQKFGDNAQEFQFSTWARRENFLGLRNSLPLEIKKAFDHAGVEIPFPQRTLHFGKSVDAGLGSRLTGGDAE